MAKIILLASIFLNILGWNNDLKAKQLSPEDEYRVNFEKRKDKLLRYFAMLNQKSFVVSLAKFSTNTDIEGAIEIFDSLITEPSGDMFFMYPSLMTYLYAEDKMPEWLKRKYRNVWKTYTPFRGDTENHWLMYYVSLYLASQRWSNQDGSEWYTGKSSEENFEEARGWIDKWIEITTTIGQGEFDSSHYMPFFLIPMFMLYEFSQDSLMKLKAQMMLDYLFSDFAVEHLSNCYCGAHSREYPPEAMNPRNSLASAFSALYFGSDPNFERNLSRYGIAVFPAVTSYILPYIIYKIATDRELPYEHRERKRVRNIIRYGSERNPAVYKYTYMTRDYCMGSLQGGILQPIHQHSWDITFADAREYNTVFSVHPYSSEIELGMFFPEEMKILPELVDRAHKFYRNPDKLISSSPYERIFQYKGTMIVLYGLDRMNDREKYKHVNIFIPRYLDHFEMDTSGWIIGSMGNAYFGMKIIGGRFEMKVDSISYRIRVYGDRICLIVEAGGESEFGNFGKFRDGLRSSKYSFDSRDFSVRYKGLRGFEMFFSYDGKRMLNGKIYPLDWGLFDGVYLRSGVGSKVLEIKYKERMRKIDFNNLKIIDETTK